MTTNAFLNAFPGDPEHNNLAAQLGESLPPAMIDGSPSPSDSPNAAPSPRTPRQSNHPRSRNLVQEPDQPNEQLFMQVVEVEDALEDSITMGTFSTVNLQDLNRKSKKEKVKSALFHLNNFLKIYMEELKECYVPANQLKLGAEPSAEDHTIKTPEWFSEMIGHFFYYLAYDAYSWGQTEKGRIAYESATGYASAVKWFFQNEFRNNQISIPVFENHQWRLLRAKLWGIHSEHVRKSGGTLSNPHLASREKDRKALAIGCLWSNCPELAEFWHLNSTMMHFSGRGSEVALIRTRHLDTIEVSEMHFYYEILQCQVKRHKNGQEQIISLYPHRDCFEEDWYFSLGYKIVMCEDAGEFICPNFAAKACQCNEDLSDSKVSAHWVHVWKKLIPMAQAIYKDLNTKLTSHHGKKGSNQKMAESGVASGLPQIFRSGWEVKGVHSLFDYVVGTQVMSQTAGKAVCNWTTKIGDSVFGGMPPTLKDVTCEKEKLYLFSEMIFLHDRDRHWKESVRHLIVAALLRHYDDVLEKLRERPDINTVYGENLMGHAFVYKIRQYLQDLQVSDATFNMWKKQIREGFLVRNMPAIPYEQFPYQLGELPSRGILLDPRCFLNHQNTLVSCFQSLQGYYDGLKQISAQNAAAIESMERRLGNMEHTLFEFMELLSKQYSQQLQYLHAIYNNNCYSKTTSGVIESQTTSGLKSSIPIPSLDSSPKPIPKMNTPTTTMRYSFVANNFKDKMRVSDYFFRFFRDECWIIYEQEKQSECWVEMSQKERDSWKGKFQRHKDLVGFMLRNVNDCPLRKPITDTELGLQQRQDWERDLELLSKEAEAKTKLLLVNNNDLHEDDSLTMSKIFKSSTFKDAKNRFSAFTPALPANTPTDLMDLFRPSNLGGRKRQRQEL
jgi:hypothetical protein